MTFADKLAAIYAAKINIREAIKEKGVEVLNTTPFSQYAAKILLISGSGTGGGSDPETPTNTTDSLAIVETLAHYGFIPIHIYDVPAQNFTLDGKPSDSISEQLLSIIYPPTTERTQLENIIFAENFDLSLSEDVVIRFSLWAVAESFLPSKAYRYSFNSEWVVFTENGAYVRDRVLENSGSLEGTTTNGVYFAMPFPNRNSYGNIISLDVSFEEAQNG
ncbi:hypothetical protein AGMMS49975_19060 [Clostridia bacterium]|nr:hypothetical protein AGMMS49975_19020 [Clostridia bacterium]GHU56190.1 hypothetical protein AGMMS49975_19060 [Clostridia bacterium]